MCGNWFFRAACHGYGKNDVVLIGVTGHPAFA